MAQKYGYPLSAAQVSSINNIMTKINMPQSYLDSFLPLYIKQVRGY